MQNAHQADIESHVAIEYVTELVCNNALQFIAVKQLHRAAGNRHHRITLEITGGESIDALLLHHIHRRRWHA